MFNIDLKNRQAVQCVNDYTFLKAFKSTNELVFFRLINEVTKYSKNESCLFTNNDEDEYPFMQDVFKRYQHKGYAIYFVVNSGGQKKEKIEKVRAQFNDFDFRKYSTGEKDENDKEIVFFRSDQEVEELKQKCIEMLQNFALEPSIIDETKNGLHVFWLIKNLDQDAEVKRFRNLEEVMISYFNNKLEDDFADPQVKDLSRVMRIPGYLHLKDPNNPFLIKAIKFNPEIKYTQEEIAQSVGTSLKDLEIEEIEEKAKQPTKRNEQLAITEDTKEETSKSTQEEKKKDIKIEIQKINESLTQQPQQIFYNYPDLLEYIRKQDPISLLKSIIPGFQHVREGEMFCCVFHNDSTPSAKIWRTKSGYYKYKCFGNCTTNPRGEDIIDLVMRVNKCNFADALDFICNKLKIRLVKTKWTEEQKDKYIQNLSAAISKKTFDSLQAKYPNFYKIISRGKALKVWTTIMDIGITNIHPSFTVEHQSLFFFSNRFLSQVLNDNSNHGRINQYINLLAVLGLIKKIKEENIPKALLDRAYKEFHEHKDNKDIICFYIAYNLNDKIQEAEKRAEKMLKAGYSIKSIGKKYVFEVFGKEFADVIYNHQIESHYTEKKEKIIYEFIISDLKKQRYFSYYDLKNKNIVWCRKADGKRLYLDEFDKERLFKRCAANIQKSFKELNIEKQRLNKELKDKLKIKNVKGYPEIYYISNNNSLI